MDLTFKERVAQIIGRIAPEWCVKKHYGSDCYWYWNLSSEKEIEIIKKLNLQKNDGLCNRYWNPSTRIYLIEQGVYDCIPQISTQGEFQALLNRLPQLPVNELITALTFYTPNSQLLLRMIRLLDNESLSKIVKARVGVFNDLKLEKLFNDFVDSNADYSKEYNLVSLLLEVTSGPWCEKVITYFMSVSSVRITEEAKYLLKEAFKISIKKGMNHADNLVYLYTNHPSIYEAAKHQAVFNIQYGMKMISYFASNAPITGKLEDKDKAEASYWLRVLIDCNDRNVLSFVKHYYDKLQQLNLDCGLMHNVWSYLLGNAQSFGSWEFCYLRADSDRKKEVARIKLASVLNCYADCETAIKYFPFAEWKEDAVKNVLYRLVEYSKMPLGKLDLLPANLREYVDYLMITRSQKMILKGIGGHSWKELFEKTHLTPDAECIMLSASYQRCNDKIAYINKYGLSNKAFRFLLDFKYSFEDGFSYLSACVSKQGLSNEQYRLVLQSQYADQAPFIAEYVK